MRLFAAALAVIASAFTFTACIEDGAEPSLTSHREALVINSTCPAGGIQVGPDPGFSFHDLSAIPWSTVTAGSVICIYPNTGNAAYLQQLHIDNLGNPGMLPSGTTGTASAHIVIRGIPSNGVRPIIDATNATCPDQLSSGHEETEGAVVVFGSTTTHLAYVDIENLDIRGAIQGHSYFGTGNCTSGSYSYDAAAVYAKQADHVTIRNCLLHGNSFGVHSQPTTTYLTYQGNQFFDNGYWDHNAVPTPTAPGDTYTAGAHNVYEFNSFGDNCPCQICDGTTTNSSNCGGEKIKDRGTDLTVRYNKFVYSRGDRAINPVDSTDCDTDTGADSDSTQVYGNIIIKRQDSNPAYSQRGVIYFGGDQSAVQRVGFGACPATGKIAGSLWRKHLRFYNNTVAAIGSTATQFQTPEKLMSFAIYSSGSSENDKIDFIDNGLMFTATITPANSYSGADLATQVQAAMRLANTNNQNNACSYDPATHHFTITGTAPFTLKWNSGANAGVSAALALGFYANADKTALAAYSSDFYAGGNPQDVDARNNIFYVDDGQSFTWGLRANDCTVNGNNCIILRANWWRGGINPPSNGSNTTVVEDPSNPNQKTATISDPGFVALSGDNVRISPGASGLLDHGMPIAGWPSVLYEYFDVALDDFRPVSGAQDIGAYELMTSAPKGGLFPAGYISSNPIIVQAENFNSAARERDSAAHVWITSTSKAGYIGTGYVTASTDDGLYSALDWTQAHLDYLIFVPTTQSYTLWYREYGGTRLSKRFHVAIDPFLGAHSLSDLHQNTGCGFLGTTCFTWASAPFSGTIPAGWHTLSLYRGDPGAAIDMIELRPSGTAADSDPDSARSAFLEGNGLVAIRSYHPSASYAAPDTHEWMLNAYNQGLRMAANFNLGTIYTTNLATTSPALKYRVRFNTAGRHYAWVQGWGGSSGSAGLHYHVSLDDSAATDANAILVLPSAGSTWPDLWGNRSDATSSAAYVDVPDLGYHTVNVWMDEDAGLVDALVLSTDPAFDANNYFFTESGHE